MRVIAGTARSMPLKTPTGDGTRPTVDRIKETLFNVIQTEVPGAVFADFFSGSGAIGIEALSRGASRAYFIEKAKEPLACIEENLRFTKLYDRAVVLKQDAFAAAASIAEKHLDVIFIDPPYGKGYEERLLSLLRERPCVDAETLFIVEETREKDFSYLPALGYVMEKQKKYKTNQHVFLRLADRNRGKNEKSNLPRELRSRNLRTSGHHRARKRNL